MEDTNKIITELRKLAVDEARVDREIRAAVESSGYRDRGTGYRRRDGTASRFRGCRDPRHRIRSRTSNSLSGLRVAREMDQIIEEKRGKPNDRQRQRPKSGRKWSRQSKFLCTSAWHYIAPGKPIQNAVIERFNGRLRDELLNERFSQH